MTATTDTGLHLDIDAREPAKPLRHLHEWVGVAVVHLFQIVVIRRRRAPFAPAAKSTDPVLAGRIGAGLIAAFPMLLVRPWLAVPVGAVGWWYPSFEAIRRRQKVANAIERELPEIVDLLTLAIGSGLSIASALTVVARRAPDGPLRRELVRAVEETRLGSRVSDSLESLTRRVGDPVRPLTTALLSSERYGTPLAATLDRLGDEVRAARRRRAEEHARRVPVKLLFPLVFCTLPAFALLTVVPLIASAAKSLRLDIG